MPPDRTHAVEVDLAERDEQHQKHKYRQQVVHQGRKELGSAVKCRHEGEHQIDDGAQTHSHRQRPVLYEAQ